MKKRTSLMRTLILAPEQVQAIMETESGPTAEMEQMLLVSAVSKLARRPPRGGVLRLTEPEAELVVQVLASVAQRGCAKCLPPIGIPSDRLYGLLFTSVASATRGNYVALCDQVIGWLGTAMRGRQVFYVELCLRYGIDLETTHQVLQEIAHLPDLDFMVVQAGRAAAAGDPPTYQHSVRIMAAQGGA